MPLHGFTAVDLGYQQGNAVSNIINRMDEPVATRTFIDLFEQIWKDTDKVADVTDLIGDHIASVYQENSPDHSDGFISRIHCGHGHVTLQHLTALVTDAGLMVVDSGALGFRNMNFVLAKRPCCA